MRKLLIVLLILLTATFLISCPGDDDEKRSISGCVYDQYLRPLSQALVVIDEKSTETDEEGFYEIRDVEKGNIDVTACKNNYFHSKSGDNDWFDFILRSNDGYDNSGNLKGTISGAKLEVSYFIIYVLSENGQVRSRYLQFDECDFNMKSLMTGLSRIIVLEIDVLNDNQIASYSSIKDYYIHPGDNEIDIEVSDADLYDTALSFEYGGSNHWIFNYAISGEKLEWAMYDNTLHPFIPWLSFYWMEPDRTEFSFSNIPSDQEAYCVVCSDETKTNYSITNGIRICKRLQVSNSLAFSEIPENIELFSTQFSAECPEFRWEGPDGLYTVYVTLTNDEMNVPATILQIETMEKSAVIPSTVSLDGYNHAAITVAHYSNSRLDFPEINLSVLDKQDFVINYTNLDFWF